MNVAILFGKCAMPSDSRWGHVLFLSCDRRMFHFSWFENVAIEQGDY